MTTAAGGAIIGCKAPGIMLLAFVPMYSLAVACAGAGTTFAGTTRVFGP